MKSWFLQGVEDGRFATIAERHNMTEEQMLGDFQSYAADEEDISEEDRQEVRDTIQARLDRIQQ